MSTTRKIRCTDCGETVPYGRLSCPSCGTLLASVAGAARSAPAAPAVAAVPAAVDDVPVADPGPAAVTAEAATAAMLLPRAPQPTAPRPVDPRRSASPLTLVPTTVVRSVAAAVSMPTSAGAATATWPGAAMAEPAKASTTAAAPTQALTGAASKVASRFDLARLGEGLDWAAAAGAGFVALGMLLPWSSSVIGAGSVNGYFSTWGVAGPAHVVVLVWSLAMLGLALVPNPVPRWIRTGVASLALGVFSLGLAWPYLIGPLGAGVGVLAVSVGAFVLIPTGVIADWNSRHVRSEPPV